jgi:hypothetical protein
VVVRTAALVDSNWFSLGVKQLDHVNAGGDGAAPAGGTSQLCDEVKRLEKLM